MNLKLEAPPIVEVMCGMFFEPVAALDPMAVGGWWHSKMRATYPGHTVQPAVTDAGTVFFAGSGPLRAWLVSADDEWIIQVQPDRFYVNWRKREAAYPRFSGEGGVLRRALLEFGRFAEYCKEELSVSIVPNTVELAKVDLIIEQKHWRDGKDLAAILPVVADIGRFAKSPALSFGLNVVEPRDGGCVLHMDLQLLPASIVDGQLARAMKIETRATCPVTEAAAFEDRFAVLNGHANEVFFGLLAPEGLKRFSTEGMAKA